MYKLYFAFYWYRRRKWWILSVNKCSIVYKVGGCFYSHHEKLTSVWDDNPKEIHLFVPSLQGTCISIMSSL